MTGPNAIVGVEMAVTVAERKPWHAIFRLLERDERVFAVLLAVVMVGGLATFSLVPLRPRHGIDLYWLVFWFAAYKVGVFALVTVNPRATGAIFISALGIDLLLVFVLAPRASSTTCSSHSSPSTRTTSGRGWGSARPSWRAGSMRRRRRWCRPGSAGRLP